jgi:hypothetical protein
MCSKYHASGREHVRCQSSLQFAAEARNGTFKLNACPMDTAGLVRDHSTPITRWLPKEDRASSSSDYLDGGCHSRCNEDVWSNNTISRAASCISRL